MMLDAYEYLSGVGRRFTAGDLAKAAAMIEPRNRNGYRRTAVTFASGGPATPADSVGQAMEQLLRHGRHLDAKAFTYELLRVHPFEDGNGRLAACVFNVLSGSTAKRCPDFKFS
jgi:hypothetical protein